MSGADEVVALGRRLGAAMRRRNHLEARAFESRNDATPETYFKQAVLDASDSVEKLRDMIAVAKASTLEGAAIQIAEALVRIELIGDGSENSELRACNRLLYSALDVVDGLADRKVAEVVTPDFDNRHVDPWRPVEQRLAEVLARASS